MLVHVIFGRTTYRSLENQLVFSKIFHVSQTLNIYTLYIQIELNMY